MNEVLRPPRPRRVLRVWIPSLLAAVVAWAILLPGLVEERGVWLIPVFVALIALVIVLPLAWAIGGREELEVTPDHLSVRRAIGPIGWTRTVEADRVLEVRTAPRSQRWFPDGGFFWEVGLTGGRIVVEVFHGLTLRFGAGMDEARAGELADRIRETLR